MKDDYESADMRSFMKSIYPHIEYVATVWIVQDENDKSYDVRAWDEWNQCNDDDLEKTCFASWEYAEEYITNLFSQYPNVYIVRDYDMDEFAEN